MSDDLYTLIGYQVEVIADWRRRQAEYFPGNDQNTRAAKELERLVAEIEQPGKRTAQPRSGPPLRASEPPLAGLFGAEQTVLVDGDLERRAALLGDQAT